MTTKDWILLLVPIILNGVVLVIFQKFVIDKYLKHRMLKDEIVKAFLDMLKEMIAHIIQSNFDSMVAGDSVNDNVLIMQKKMVEIVKYYHTNNYDLKKFQKEFDSFNESWMSFQNARNEYDSKSSVNMRMREDLGAKIQSVFDSLNALIEKVRKRY